MLCCLSSIRAETYNCKYIITICYNFTYIHAYYSKTTKKNILPKIPTFVLHIHVLYIANNYQNQCLDS